MTHPMWPNVDRYEYWQDRLIEERQTKGVPVTAVMDRDRLALLALILQTYALSELSLTDLIAMLLQRLA